MSEADDLKTKQFLVERNEFLLAEAEELRRMLIRIQDRHGRAERALRFYADPKSYRIRGTESGVTFQDHIIGDYSDADNSKRIKLAGTRARLYFADE